MDDYLKPLARQAGKLAEDWRRFARIVLKARQDKRFRHLQCDFDSIWHRVTIQCPHRPCALDLYKFLTGGGTPYACDEKDFSFDYLAFVGEIHVQIMVVRMPIVRIDDCALVPKRAASIRNTHFRLMWREHKLTEGIFHSGPRKKLKQALYEQAVATWGVMRFDRVRMEKPFSGGV